MDHIWLLTLCSFRCSHYVSKFVSEGQNLWATFFNHFHSTDRFDYLPKYRWENDFSMAQIIKNYIRNI